MKQTLEDQIEAAKRNHARRHRALQLREEGYTLDQIGKELDVSKQRVEQMVKVAREERDAG